MPEPAPKTELLRSLGRLTRGLSSLFWGLPVTLVLSVQAVASHWLSLLGPWGGFAPVAGYALLYYGLWLMSDFQRQERIWIAALDRGKLLALANLGLAPFLPWYQRLPEVPLFQGALQLLALGSLVYLYALNRLLCRLAAMLPDETLRLETRVFTRLNAWFLLCLPILVLGWRLLMHHAQLPLYLQLWLRAIEPIQFYVFLFSVVLPVAITMSLLWKIKDAIFESAFTKEP